LFYLFEYLLFRCLYLDSIFSSKQVDLVIKLIQIPDASAQVNQSVIESHILLFYRSKSWWRPRHVIRLRVRC
jgi:hypothetical protein